MLLHTPTLFMLMILISLFMAGSLLYMGHRRHPELRLWALALLLNGATYLMFAVRGHVPVWLGLVAPNLLLTASYAVFAEGVYCFQQRRPVRHWLWLPLALSAALALIFQAHDVARILAVAIVNICQVMWVLALLTQQRRHTAGRGQYLVALGLLGVVLVYALRSTLALVAPEQLQGIAANHLGQAAGFALAIISVLLIAQGMVVMLEERTEHTLEASAEQLRASERHYRTLINAAHEGICVLHQGRVRYANPRLMTLTGYRYETVLNEPFLNFLHADDRQRAVEFHHRRLQGQADNEKIEVRLQTASHGMRWVEVSGVRYEWDGEPATLNFIHDITNRKQREAQVLDFAYRDSLTELPNRRALEERLNHLLHQLADTPQHAALLFLDLDNFKPLNDAEGHAMGDLLLIEVARRLRLCVRDHDMVARFGGDEFVALVTQLDANPELAREQAWQFAERLRLRLGEPYTLPVWHNGGQNQLSHRCSASVGVVLLHTGETTANTLLEQADQAMYSAKQQGRNQVVIAAPLSPALAQTTPTSQHASPPA